MNEQLFANVGRTFLKVFGSALIVVLVGITSQKTLHGAIGFGVAGLMAAIAAGISAIVVFVPQLSLSRYLPGLFGTLADAFVHAFLGTFLVAIAGILAEPNYSTWHSLLIAAFVGAFNAGFRAIQGFLTPNETPAPAVGVRPVGKALVL